MDPQPSAPEKEASSCCKDLQACWAGLHPPSHHPLWISPFRRGRCADRSQSSRGCAEACGEAQTLGSPGQVPVPVSRWGQSEGTSTNPAFSASAPISSGQWAQWESRPQEQSTQDLCCRPVSIATECLQRTLC